MIQLPDSTSTYNDGTKIKVIHIFRKAILLFIIWQYTFAHHINCHCHCWGSYLVYIFATLILGWGGIMAFTMSQDWLWTTMLWPTHKWTQQNGTENGMERVTIRESLTHQNWFFFNSFKVKVILLRTNYIARGGLGADWNFSKNSSAMVNRGFP